MRLGIFILAGLLLASGEAMANPRVDCDASMRLEPGAREYLLSRGICLLNRGFPDLAISDFETFIAEHPDWVAGYFNRGNAFFAKRDYDLAIADYDRALALPANDPAGIVWNRGNARAEKRDYAGAIADYDQAITSRPNVADLHRIRAEVYEKAGERIKAIEGYRKALSLDGENKAAQNGLRELTDTVPTPPTAEPVGAVTIAEPRYAGLRVDWCRFWREKCGKPAADEFCRRRGFAQAASFMRAPHIGKREPTTVLGSGQVCDRAMCDGFASVTCSR